MNGFVELRVLGEESDLQAFAGDEFGTRLRGELRVFRFNTRRGLLHHHGLQRPKFGDLDLLGRDQRVELGDLHRVLALLAFPKAEDVGHVGGTGAMEPPLVFSENDASERFDVGRGRPFSRFSEEGTLDRECGRTVAVAGEVDAVPGDAIPRSG